MTITRIVRPTDTPPRIVLHFNSTAARDTWLTENAPKRRCSNTVPGLYSIPGGGRIGVFCERVTLYGRAAKLAPISAAHAARETTT